MRERGISFGPPWGAEADADVAVDVDAGVHVHDYVNETKSDQRLEGPPRLEPDGARGLDLDARSGPRVPAGAGLARAHLEGAEADELDALVLLDPRLISSRIALSVRSAEALEMVMPFATF
jgi:hypothetical protein